MIGNVNRTAVLAACAGVLAAGLGLVGAGTASADTVSCSNANAAATNGNLANDVPQQANKAVGTVLDMATCTAKQANSGLNGADNPPS
jgi:hypothetical protein